MNLIVKIFKNRIRRIPAGNSIPELGFGFFYVKGSVFFGGGTKNHFLKKVAQTFSIGRMTLRVGALGS